MARVEVGNLANTLTTEDLEFVASQHCSKLTVMGKKYSY